MASFTAVFDTEQPHPEIPAWRALLIVNRDNAYFQYVAVSVRTEALHVIDAAEPPHGLLSSLARMSEAYVRQAISETAIPLPEPTDAYEIFLDDPQLVSTAMAALTPPFRPGQVLWTFDL
jgi:hypothetical protein